VIRTIKYRVLSKSVGVYLEGLTGRESFLTGGIPVQIGFNLLNKGIGGAW